jgi:hypothetical protein
MRLRRLESLALAGLTALLASCGSSTGGVQTASSGGPKPEISAVLPGKSPLEGGGYALVKGVGFKSDLTLTVRGVPVAKAQVFFVDKQTFAFKVPASTQAGGADIKVKNADSSESTFTSGIDYQATTAPAPQLSKVTPNSGPITGGTYAKIEGQGFIDGAIVLVAGAPASIVTVLTPGLLTARLPAAPAGAGTNNLIVTNPDGQSAVLGDGFAFADLGSSPGPQLQDVIPNEGPVAGGNKALVKADKLSVGALLFVGGQPADYTQAAGGLQATMPGVAKHGLVDLAITNTNGQTDVLPGAYNYIQTKLTVPPGIARVTPNRGLPAGGGRVIIEGEGFSAGAQALIGAAPCTDAVVTPPRVLTCVVPPGAAGPADVTVQNDDGGLATFAKGFTYAASSLAAPTVTLVLPNSGPSTGGTVAAVAGTGFVEGAVVIVGGRPAGSIVRVDGNLLTGRFPALAPGAADVVVTNPDGQSGKLGSGFTVAASVNASPPRINSISPSAGPVEGGVSALLTGDGFSPGARVYIGGRPANATTTGGTIIVIVPAGIGPGLADVAVTNGDGQSDVLPGGFNYFNGPPVVTGIAPTCGVAGGGTQVTITGRNFKPGVGATVGGKPLSGFSRPDTGTIQGTTTAAPGGSVDVVVTNPDGQVDTLPAGYTFTDASHSCPQGSGSALTLTRVAPGSGPATGGTVVTLIGGGFLAGAVVKFGDTVATDLKLLGPGAATVTLPASARLGPVDVSLTLQDGRSAKLPGAFTYFDPSSNLPAPQISAIAPNAGPNTGSSVVLVTGSNFVTGARVFFGPAEAQLPTLVDGGRLIVVTPNSPPGPVDVVVLNPDGKSGTLAYGFAFYQAGAGGTPPQATRCEPRTGSTLSATAVSVKGSGLLPGAQVFFGGVPAGNVQAQGDGSLAVTVQPQAPGTVDVTVTNPDGQSSTIAQGFTFSPPAPKLTAIAPSVGPLAGGTTAVISGTGFLKTDLIAFGGTLAAVKVLDDTAIFATVPPHDAGKVDVTLVRNQVTADTLPAAYTYDPNFVQTPPPSVASLEPATGPLSGGTVLWLTGANLLPGVKIFFGALPAAKIVLADAGHAVVTAPPGAAAGFVDVNVINADGQAGALLRGFSYVADALLSGLAPKLTSVTPSAGPESSDTTAILTGRNFVAGEYVFVGAARGAGVRLLSASILNTTFPHQPASAVDVSVTHPDGRSSVLPGGFTFLARPTLVSVANTNNQGAGATGPTVGGTAVTIAGTGFQQGATITFGRTPATSVVVRSETILTAVTPPGVAGPADVQLINPDGQTALLAGGWQYVAPPKATALTPPTGPLRGGTYAILSGSDFNQSAVVTVGGVQATTVWGSPNSMLVITAAASVAGAVDVVVKNPDGQTSTLTGGFTYSSGPFGPAPTLATIAPVTGPDTGGTFVQITGGNFNSQNGGAIGIVGGSGLGRNRVIGTGTITGLTGPGPIDSAVVVAVTNPDGQSAHLDGAFTYRDHNALALPPVVDHAVPAQALAPGGTAIAVLGANFSKGQSPLVFMQGIPAAVSLGTTDKQINVITPAAQPGPADIAVVNPDGQTSIKTNAFTFLVPPPQFDGTTPLCVVQGANCVTPARGPTAGNTVVRINGAYFQPPVQVYFGNAAGVVNVDPSLTNDHMITVTTPGGSAGFVGVRVINQDGQSAPAPGAANPPQFYYQSPPILTQVQPTSGSPNGGELITLRGQYFSGDATSIKVKFGAAPAPVQGTPTATVMQVLSPAQTAAGQLTVAITITNDDGQSSITQGAFIYLPPPAPPTLAGVTPNAGPQQGGNTVTVLGQHFQYGARVFFSTATASYEATSVTVSSDSALSCVVPAATTTGAVSLKVTNPDGNSTPASPAVLYTYVSGPAPSLLKIQAITPSQGVTTGGTPVLISGTGFQSGAVATLIAKDGSQCAGSACQLLNLQTLGPTAMLAVMPPQPIAGVAGYNLQVQNPGGGSDLLLNAWSYGNGTRHFTPYGLRMPMEANSGKYNRTDVTGQYMPSWQATTGDFTRSQAGVTDVFIGANGGRAPRLYQGDFDPVQGTSGKARVFKDLSATNLKNPDGSVMKDNCCGSSSPSYQYSTFQPRTLDMNGDGQADVVFWNDVYGFNGFSLFLNTGGGLQAANFNQPWGYGTNATDWVGGYDTLASTSLQQLGGTSRTMIDFNLDGAPDLLAVGNNIAPMLLLSCGGSVVDAQTQVRKPKPASPYCNLGSGSRPYINVALAVGTQTITAAQAVSFQNTVFSNYMKPGARWILDSGVNTEIVTIASTSSTPTNNFTTTFAKAHVANVNWSPVVETMAHAAANIVANTDVSVTLDDTSGFALSDWWLLAEPGAATQEWVHVVNTTNYATSKITIHFNQAHPKDLLLTVRNPNNFVYDGTRFNASGAAYTVVAGDLDGDGDLDVITGNQTEGLKVFLNNAADLVQQGKDPIAFTMSTSAAITSQAFPGGVTNGNVRALALFDVNGDGLADLLVGYKDNLQEKLFMNRGGGQFVDEASSIPVSSPKCLNGGTARLPVLPPNGALTDSIVRYDIRDIDGNGAPDVLAWIQVTSASNTFKKSLRLWANDGKGCFYGQPTDYSTGGLADTLFNPSQGILQTWVYGLGDFNKDGLPDMIAGFEGVQTREYVNFGGYFVDKTVSNFPDSTTASSSVVWWKWTFATLLTDLNGDGFTDMITSQVNRDPNYNIATASQGGYGCDTTPRVCDPDGSIKLYKNDQQGNFPNDDTLNALPTAVQPGSNPPKIVSALPIASYGMDTAPLSVGGTQAIIISSATDYLNGIPAILQGTPFNNRYGATRLLLSNGNGTFRDATYPLLPTNGQIFGLYDAVKFVDLDNDGYQDIVIGDIYEGQVHIWKGTPGGFFIDVTGTALPGGLPAHPTNCCSANSVHKILTGNLDKDNQNLTDLLVLRQDQMRLLINHSDVQNQKIFLVDETNAYAGQPNQRLPNPPPSGFAAVISNFDCGGGDDIYYLDTGGGEHLLTNTACLQGGQCGYFNDVTNTPGVLPPESKGSNCVGTDCAGNVGLLGLNYNSGNTDLFILRTSDGYNTVRPHRLLQNNCGQFVDITRAAWTPLPTDNDRVSTNGIYGADIFGHQQAGDGNGTVKDLMIMSQYGPRIYRNGP